MKNCIIDWDLFIKVIIMAVIPLLSLIIAIISLHYKRLTLKIILNSIEKQGPNEKYKWSLTLTFSNAGFTPFTIMKLMDRNRNQIEIPQNDQKIPFKLEPGDIITIKFPFE